MFLKTQKVFFQFVKSLLQKQNEQKIMVSVIENLFGNISLDLSLALFLKKITFSYLFFNCLLFFICKKWRGAQWQRNLIL